MSSSAELAHHWDDAAPAEWPPAAKSAWQKGTLACRALAQARGAAAAIAVGGEPGSGLAWAPFAALARAVEGFLALQPLIVELWRGQSLPRPRDVMQMPEAPTDADAVLRAGAPEQFDPVQVSGCVRPLPSALVVEPDVPMASMIEYAWSRVPASARTGEPATCSLQTFAMPCQRRRRRRSAARWTGSCPSPPK